MSDLPVIELKSIKNHHQLSRETNAYSARLFVDGRHVCDVSNDGGGGCDRMDGPGKGLSYGEARRLYDELDRRVRNDFPKQDMAEDGEPARMVEDSLEYLCARLVERHALLQPILRMMKKGAAFFKDGRPTSPGTPLYTIDARGGDVSKAVAAARQRHPSAWILNEQTHDDVAAAARLAA